jgi:hypothetical protein
MAATVLTIDSAKSANIRVIENGRGTQAAQRHGEDEDAR